MPRARWRSWAPISNLTRRPGDRHRRQGASNAAADGVGTTALVFAIINVHYDLAAMLLEQGADPNVVDLAGMGPLYAAVDMNSLQWVQGRPAPILTRYAGRRRAWSGNCCSTRRTRTRG